MLSLAQNKHLTETRLRDQEHAKGYTNDPAMIQSLAEFERIDAVLHTKQAQAPSVRVCVRSTPSTGSAGRLRKAIHARFASESLIRTPTPRQKSKQMSYAINWSL
jgi:hypothetical protein